MADPFTIPADVRVVDDAAELVAFYADTPGAHIYAVADLEAPYWEPSTWYRRGDAVVGFVRLPAGAGTSQGATTVYAVATRDPQASLDLLVELLPLITPGMLITAPAGLRDALAPHREIEWEAPHVRHVLSDVNDALAHVSSRVEPIDGDRVAELSALYASDPGAAFFLPHMIEDQSYVGVFDDRVLVAAAGTHVLSPAHRCAAIGGVYTRPTHRGQGLGRAVTAGVVARIADRADLIGLNVAASNAPARAAYERLGFRPVLTYSEAQIN